MGLAGKRVLITRAAEDAADLRDALEARGASVVSLPTLVRAPPEDQAAVQDAAVALSRDAEIELVAVGSLAALRPLGEAMTGPSRAVIACVGRKTAAGLDDDPVLAHRFVGPRIVPDAFHSEALLEAVNARFGSVAGLRVLVPRAPEGRTALLDGLRARGAVGREVITYRIRPAAPPTDDLWARAQTADVAVFLSGQTLANFLTLVPQDDARRLLARLIVGVIGPVAERRAAELGIRVDIVPSRATQAALIEALDDRL